MLEKKKDMSKLSDLKRFGQVIKDKFGDLHNYGNGGPAVMFWGQNEAMSTDQVFGLEYRCEHCQKDTTALLDWQEVMHYGRAVSDWKHAFEQMKKDEEQRKNH